MAIADWISTFLYRRKLRGATRFHRFVLSGRRLKVKSKHGLVLQIDPGEHVDNFVLHDGFYEEEVLAALTERLGPDEVFWDVGSNLGLHALTVKRMRPNVRVYAFEPNPAMSVLIRSAADRNQVAIEVMETALDETEGKADFFIYEGNCGMSALHHSHPDLVIQRIEVTKATGDRMVSAAQAITPNAMKIDVEGNERRVLQGMRAVLADRRLHTVVFEDSRDAASPVKTILQSHGFAIESLTRREATEHNLENFVARRSW